MYNDGSYANQFYGLAPAPGTFKTYAVVRWYDLGAGSWAYDVKINGIWKATYHLGWVPDNAVWLGEINTYGSQMPGDTANHVGLKLVQWQDTQGVWIDADVPRFVGTVGDTGGNDLSWFHSQKIASDWYSIWDGKC